MTYNYSVLLEIANENARGEFNFMNIEEQIKDAINTYHQTKTIRNKKVLSYVVTPKILEMRIISPVELEVPSKALAKFTRILITKSPELVKTIKNGRVFQSVKTTIPNSDLDKYSAKETLKKLIEIFCEDNRDHESTDKTNTRLEIQRKIKSIIFNAV